MARLLKPDMQCSYKFHSIGQGCFYTSHFEKSATSKVNIIYDCGSVSSSIFLRDSVDKYKKTLPMENKSHVIDMLIISHFDEDHVNGVFDLLANSKCKVLIIPFMTIHERLALFGKGQAKAEWHAEMLADPIAYFLNENKFNIERIIVIGGNDDFTNNETEIIPNIVDDPEDTLSIEMKLIKAVKLPIASTVSFSSLKADSPKVTFFKMPFAISILGKWLLKFYNGIDNKKSLKNFQLDVARDFPTIDINGLFKETNRKRIKLLYKRNFKNVNFSSLSVSCTPKSQTFLYYLNESEYGFSYSERKAGILLTGDSFLKSKANIDKFVHYYKNELGQILIYQIPHHGSNNNSKIELSNRLMDFPVMVINHGHGRKKHPHKELVDFLGKHKKQVSYNTEHKEFSLTFEITF